MNKIELQIAVALRLKIKIDIAAALLITSVAEHLHTMFYHRASFNVLVFLLHCNSSGVLVKGFVLQYFPDIRLLETEIRFATVRVLNWHNYLLAYRRDWHEDRP